MFGIIFVFLANAIALTVPVIIGQTVNLIEERRIGPDNLFDLAFLALCLAGVAACFRFLMRRVIIDVSREVEYEFRNDFFRKLQTLDPSFFDARNTGDLMSRATNDTDALRMLMGPGVMYTANTLFSLPLALTAMMWLDWRLTLVCMAPMLVLTPLVKYFGSRTHRMSRLQQDSFGELTTTVQENLAGIRVVKAYRQEDFELRKFLERNDDYIAKSLELARLQAMFFPSIRLVVGFGFTVLLLYGGHRIIQGHLEVGTLLSFLLLFGMLVWPLIAAGWVINLIQRGIASLERINAILESQPQVAEPEDGAAVVEAGTPTIEFRSLTFQYEGTSQPQLKNIDLLAPPGKTIGVVGPVGAGKSTLVNLLSRFYPVPRGMLFFGGRDINDWPLGELRKRISFVFQETFLFSDTIGWNIRFGSEDRAPQELVEEAAEIAKVHGDIGDLPRNYSTVLGERGVNLSGGQRQRVAIARALMRQADILVLDDTLSAVDTHTEEAILGELRRIMERKTTFLISHRLSTVATADEILVLHEGSVVQRGTHADLVARPGWYAEMYSRQLSERAIEDYDEEGFAEDPAP